MNEERRRILTMVAEGKITASEAEELLAVMDSQHKQEGEGMAGMMSAPITAVQKPKPRFLRVVVHSGGNEHVDVRVPLALIRAGAKLGALIPDSARVQINNSLSQKGIQLDLASLDPKSLDELVEAFADLTVNVNDGNDQVRVFCE